MPQAEQVKRQIRYQFRMVVPMTPKLRWRGFEMHCRSVVKLNFSCQKQSGESLIMSLFCVLTPTTKKSALPDSVSWTGCAEASVSGVLKKLLMLLR
jgi:hypothetical protein